jgi:hypothetical protein
MDGVDDERALQAISIYNRKTTTLNSIHGMHSHLLRIPCWSPRGPICISHGAKLPLSELPSFTLQSSKNLNLYNLLLILVSAQRDKNTMREVLRKVVC